MTMGRHQHALQKTSWRSICGPIPLSPINLREVRFPPRTLARPGLTQCINAFLQLAFAHCGGVQVSSPEVHAERRHVEAIRRANSWAEATYKLVQPDAPRFFLSAEKGVIVSRP
jgi:hypothetical protein